MRQHVKVTFKNGDHIETDINGTEQEIRDYYRIGSEFNLGSGGEDDMQKVAKVEFLPGVKENATTDDYDLPIGPEGLRRFATSKPDKDGSTAAALLGKRGHAQWVKDSKERGETVPSWESGKKVEESAASIVAGLIEAEASPTVHAQVEAAKQFVDSMLSEEDEAEEESCDQDPEDPNIPPGMHRIVDDLVNGNLSDAKRRAARYSQGALQLGFFFTAGFSKRKATAAAVYLKNPSQDTWQQYCDAE